MGKQMSRSNYEKLVLELDDLKINNIALLFRLSEDLVLGAFISVGTVLAAERKMILYLIRLMRQLHMMSFMPRLTANVPSSFFPQTVTVGSGGASSATFPIVLFITLVVTLSRSLLKAIS